jgi:hypothetical protein
MPPSEQRKELDGKQKENRLKKVKKAHFVIIMELHSEKPAAKMSKKTAGSPADITYQITHNPVNKKPRKNRSFRRDFTILTGARCGT